MTADFRLNWTLPAQPLGEAIKPEKPVKVCEFREFDSKPHEVEATEEVLSDEVIRAIHTITHKIDKWGRTVEVREAAPPKGEWARSRWDTVEEEMYWVGDRCSYTEAQAAISAFSGLKWTRLP